MGDVIYLDGHNTKYIRANERNGRGYTMDKQRINKLANKYRENPGIVGNPSKMKEYTKEILREFNIDPYENYVPIVSITKDFGINTYMQEMKDSDLSAYISVDPTYYERYGSARIACVNQSDAPGHRRFALAHELGHYLFDYKLETLQFYDTYIKNSNKDSEKEKRANLFAANLLMPENAFRKKRKELESEGIYSSTDVIIELANHFRVTTKSIIKRIDELNLEGEINV